LNKTPGVHRAAANSSAPCVSAEEAGSSGIHRPAGIGANRCPGGRCMPAGQAWPPRSGRPAMTGRPRARHVIAPGYGPCSATVRSRCVRKPRVNTTFTCLNTAAAGNQGRRPSLLVRYYCWPNGQITGYYPFCDLRAPPTIAAEIGFVDFLTHCRYACPGWPRGYLQQAPPDPAFISFLGLLKRIVLATRR